MPYDTGGLAASILISIAIINNEYDSFFMLNPKNFGNSIVWLL